MHEELRNILQTICNGYTVYVRDTLFTNQGRWKHGISHLTQILFIAVTTWQRPSMGLGEKEQRAAEGAPLGQSRTTGMSWTFRKDSHRGQPGPT